MLLDVRTYTCKPGTIKAHLDLYEKMGKEPQTRNLGQPLAYLTTETGNRTSMYTFGCTTMQETGRRSARRCGQTLIGSLTRRRAPSWARWKRRKIS